MKSNVGQFNEQTLKLYSVFEHNRRLKNNRIGQKWPKSTLALTLAYRRAQSYKQELEATEDFFVWFGGSALRFMWTLVRFVPSLMYNLMYWMHWEGQMSYFCVSFSSSYRNTQHMSQSLHDNASFKGTVHLKINTL